MSRASRRAYGRVAAVMLAATIASHAVAQAVYRCDDRKGSTLYSDTPCNGGAKVDLLPGKADPAAIERVRREQRAFDERQAARELRAQQDALGQRENRLAQREWQLDAAALADRYAPEPMYGWGGVWAWYPVAPVVPRAPPRPPRPDVRTPPPYVPAMPRQFGLPSPPPARPAPPARPMVPVPQG